MIRTYLLAAMTLFAMTVHAQPPATEIYLFDITLHKDRITLTNSVNITNRKGYDNQPYFHPDKPLIYYTAGDSTGTDIFAFDYATSQTTQITRTPENEYSPTVTPDKNFLSCIIQRENGAQDLGKYPIAGGGEATVLINNLVVGYHAWMNENDLLLFVLGEPITLHQYTLGGKDKVLAQNVGRSLHAIPNSSAMSYVSKTAPDKWEIIRMTRQIMHPITETLPKREDLAWTPDGRILMSDGEKLFFFKPAKNATWKPVEINTTLPLKGITRLAVSSKGDKLAIVVSE